MDDEITLQVVEHCYALLLSMFTFIKRNNLSLANCEFGDAMNFHISRLQALLDEMDHPFKRNPILGEVSRQLTEGKSPEDAIVPRSLLFGFTESEIKAWVDQEPNFDKPIIRRRFTGRNNRRRLDSTMLAQYLLE